MATTKTPAHDGRLKLDAPVSKYVSGLDPGLGKITIDRLLSQTSELRDEPAEYGTHEENALAAYVRSWSGSYAILPPDAVGDPRVR